MNCNAFTYWLVPRCISTECDTMLRKKKKKRKTENVAGTCTEILRSCCSNLRINYPNPKHAANRLLQFFCFIPWLIIQLEQAYTVANFDAAQMCHMTEGIGCHSACRWRHSLPIKIGWYGDLIWSNLRKYVPVPFMQLQQPKQILVFLFLRRSYDKEDRCPYSLSHTLFSLLLVTLNLWLELNNLIWRNDAQ